MAKQVQLLRGTTAENDAFTGEEGVLTYNTQNKSIRVHDGSKKGGNLLDTVVAYQMPTSSNNYRWYRKYASGWVEQGGSWSGYDSISGNTMAINLPVAMKDNKYTASIVVNLQASDTGSYFARTVSETSTSQLKYLMFLSGAVTTNNPHVSWQVSGIAA